MINEEMLRTKIENSGYRLRYIAEKLGISYQAFLNKIHGKSSFKAPEIAALCKVLKITDRERTQIFFATKSRQ